MPIMLQPRDHRLLYALAFAVRLLSLQQIASWWRNDRANTRRRLQRLAEANLLQKATVLARTLPAIGGPLCCWKPGATAPHAGRASYLARRRWRRRPQREQTVYLASARMLEHFGLPRRTRPKPYQNSHALGVAATWLHFTSRWPRLTAACWLGEDAFAPREPGQAVEDALLRHRRTGRPLLAIEFAGSYRKDRFVKLHGDFVARSLPYRCY